MNLNKLLIDWTSAYFTIDILTVKMFIDTENQLINWAYL